MSISEERRKELNRLLTNPSLNNWKQGYNQSKVNNKITERLDRLERLIQASSSRTATVFVDTVADTPPSDTDGVGSGDPVGQVELQITIDITVTGAGTVIDLSGSNFKEVSMQVISRANTGSFTSATVELEVSNVNVAADFVPSGFLQIVSSGAGSQIDWTEINALFIRYNITELTKTGDADIDIIITGKD